MEMMENSWINPFSTGSQDLLNIAAGIAAPENIKMISYKQKILVNKLIRHSGKRDWKKGSPREEIS